MITTEKPKPIPDIYMEWARLFSQDPNSDKLVSGNALNDAVNAILALQTKGSVIKEIVCTGFASDEDDTSDTHPTTLNPGFGIPSQKNIDLATKRGSVVTTGLAEMLSGSLPNVPIINAQGQEVRDDELANAIFNISANNHMSPVQLVKEFNRGYYRHLSAVDLTVLNGLASHRFVRCVVFIEETSSGDSVNIIPAHVEHVPASQTTRLVTTTKEIADPGVNGADTHVAISDQINTGSSNSSGGGKRFKIVFIPIIIPSRRRTKGTEEPVNVNVDHLPIVPPSIGVGTGSVPLSSRANHIAAVKVVPLSRTGPNITTDLEDRSSGVRSGGGGGTIHINPPLPPLPRVRPSRIHTPHLRQPNQSIKGQGIPTTAAHRVKQPRPHNYSKKAQEQGGRRGREKGGNINR